jgi:hypothetical protein
MAALSFLPDTSRVIAIVGDDGADAPWLFATLIALLEQSAPLSVDTLAITDRTMPAQLSTRPDVTRKPIHDVTMDTFTALLAESDATGIVAIDATDALVNKFDSQLRVLARQCAAASAPASSNVKARAVDGFDSFAPSGSHGRSKACRLVLHSSTASLPSGIARHIDTYINVAVGSKHARERNAGDAREESKESKESVHQARLMTTPSRSHPRVVRTIALT